MISAPVFCPQFVGRRPELSFLIERRRDLGKAHGGLVLVGGDAGIGKSRLLREFLDETGKSRGRIAIGRCRPFASAPYEPLIELLATLAPAAASLSPAQTQAEQLRAIADAFIGVAEKHALVGIIEDLHWSDTGTLDVLAFLAERLGTSRMLIIATYRANELGPAHPHYVAFGALQRSRSVASIALGPLSPIDSRIFIDATLRDAPGDVPIDARRDVAQVAEGNPFFTEELLRSVVDRRRLHQSDRSLPTTVHAAILERLQPLAGPDRAILTQAAVIGRRFDVNLLAHTLDVSITDVLVVMQQARALQIVEETDDPGTFRFRHALTRAAIYDELLRAQRRPLHRRIALALEAHAAWNASPDALGYHWWAAGDRPKALEHGERCGDAAHALHAYADAIESYERTLSLFDADDHDAARIRVKIGTSFFRSGVMDRAIDVFRVAWDWSAREPRDAWSVFRLARFLAAALYNDGRTREGTAFLRTAIATIAQCGDHRVTEHARLTLATYLADSGEIEETHAILRDVDAERISDDIGLTIAFWQTTCKIAALEGDVAGVEHAAAQIVAIESHPADATALIEGLADAGITALTVGATAVARRCLTRAIDTCVTLKLSASHGDVLVESALERMASGAYSEARALVTRALPMIGEGQLGRHRAVIAALSIGIALDDKELLDYEPDAAFLEHVFETHVPLVYAPLAALCAVRLASRGETQSARRLLRRAVRTTLAARRPFGSFPLVIVAAQYAERVDADEVRELCALTRAGGPAPSHAAALAEAILLQRLDDNPSARAHAERAAAGFASIGWPLYEALALECAGQIGAAERIHERIGYRGPAQIAGRARDTSLELALTARELQIAQHVAKGLTNREIATSLSVSVKLIEKHLSSIYAKLALTSRSQLTARIIERDIEHRSMPSSLKSRS